MALGHTASVCPRQPTKIIHPASDFVNPFCRFPHGNFITPGEKKQQARRNCLGYTMRFSPLPFPLEPARQGQDKRFRALDFGVAFGAKKEKI